MKKLLVLALSAIMILSLAAVSMAAVTVGGEFAAMYKTGAGSTNNDSGNAQEKVNNGRDQQETKVTFTGNVSDAVTAFVAIKLNTDKTDTNANVKFDESWVSMKNDLVTGKIGYFGYGFGGKKDILDLYMRDMKASVGSLVTFNVAEGMTVGLYYAIDGQQNMGDGIPGPMYLGGNTTAAGLGDGAYALSFNYANDTFGGGISIADYAFKNNITRATNPLNNYDTDTGMALNFFYNLSPFTFYFVYDSMKVKNVGTPGATKDWDNAFCNEIIGVSFAPADLPFYARFEYDLEDQTWFKNNNTATSDVYEKNKWNAWGFYVGYKFTDAVKLQYKRKQVGKVFDCDENELKLVVAF